MKIAIAGASGFVGRALVTELQKNHEVVAFSRTPKDSQNGVVWRSCDLFSMLDAEIALQGTDVAVYLVHSVRPSANLTQGTFDDFDLIVADNFVRAAEKVGIKQIIYLGGMRPHDDLPLSNHLRSRWEVEQIFRESTVPVTILRAAIILGAEGFSFHIMTRLVQRLPVMLCPVWARTESHPIALSDVVASISFCVGNEGSYRQVYEIGMDSPISCITIMEKISQKLDLPRKIIKIPFLSLRLSALWVHLVTGASAELAKRFIGAGKTSLPLRLHRRLRIPGRPFKDLNAALDEALEGYKSKNSTKEFFRAPLGPKTVRSVQRLTPSSKLSAEEVALAYLEYLPRGQAGFLKIIVDGKWIYFCWRFPLVRLLILEYSPERSSTDRQLFYVRGGLLAQKTVRGRLEFREVLNGEAIIAAIHDFQPRLPWFFYRWTQAFFHLWVMKKFGKFLARVNKKTGQDQLKI